MVTAKTILIPDASIPIQPDDAILRPLPSGIVERLIVIDPNFHAQSDEVEAYYQIKYYRESQSSDARGGYVVHIAGDNSRVNIHSTDKSQNAVHRSTQDLVKIADELDELRGAVLRELITHGRA